MPVSLRAPAPCGVVLGGTRQAEIVAQALSLALPFPVTTCAPAQWPSAAHRPLELLLLPAATAADQVVAAVAAPQIRRVAGYAVADDEQALWLLQQGVDGAFYHDDPVDTLTKGGRILLAGELWYKRRLFSHYILQEERRPAVAEPAQRMASFSRRELEVLALLAQGAQNGEIATSLFISPHTVKSHIRSIFKKLGASCRTEVATWATKRQALLAGYLGN